MIVLVCIEKDRAGISKERIAATHISYPQVDRWLWQWCLEGETLLRLCILIALALIASLVVPQSPTQAQFDLTSFEQWLSTTAISFQTWSSLFSGLGLFRIAVTPWFRFLLAVTAFVSLVALGSRIDSFLRPLPGARDLFYDADAIVIPSSQSFQVVVGAVGGMMDKLGASVQDVQGQRAWLYGVHYRLVQLLQSFVYLGVLLIVLGLAMNGRWGWVRQDAQVLPGQIVSPANDAPLQLELVSIDSDRAEAVIRTADETDIHLRQNDQVCVRGFCYQLAGRGGPLVQIDARDDGQISTLYSDVAYAGSAGGLVFSFSPSAPSDDADRLFIVPDYQVFGRLQWQNKGTPDQPAEFRFTVFDQDSQVLASDRITAQDRSASIDVGAVRFDLELSSYAMVSVSYYPGLAVIVAGIVCLIVASVATYFPWQQVWASVTVEPDRVVTRLWERSYGWPRAWKQTYQAMVSDLQVQIQAPGMEGIES
ncbi:MAG: hypothetical protein JXA89_06260 [Anaerolineae bacterium]|nr:hypothetical protein [Anaerolineae bacterium]